MQLIRKLVFCYIEHHKKIQYHRQKQNLVAVFVFVICGFWNCSLALKHFIEFWMSFTVLPPIDQEEYKFREDISRFYMIKIIKCLKSVLLFEIQ